MAFGISACENYTDSVFKMADAAILDFVAHYVRSQAGLSRVNGVRPSSAKTWNVDPSPKSQFYINLFHIRRGWLR